MQRTIRAQKSRRAAVTAAGLLLLGVPLVGTVFLAESENMVESGKLAYSRSLESEADLAAVRALAATGYDPGQMALYFELLAREEAEAGINDPYLYDDHPATLVRQRDCEREAARLRARDATIATHVGTGAHERAITSVLLPTAEMNLKLRRIEHARFEIERYVRLRPEAGDGHLALGDVLRRRAGGSVEKLAEAEKAYLRAVQLDPDLAAARRELGLVYRAQGRSREAREQLTRYLALAPAAPDRGIIEAYID